MKPGLSLRVSQHLALTPQLQQSIRLLQLSTLELASEVEQMLDDNPFLERDDEAAPREEFGLTRADARVSEGDRIQEVASESIAAGADGSGAEAEFGTESPLPDSWDGDGSVEVSPDDGEWGGDAPARANNLDGDDELDPGERARPQESLAEHLHRQALALRLSPEDTAALRFLIESLNDDGYLEDSLAQLAATLTDEGDDLEHLEELVHRFTLGLKLLQSLEPAGVGARNLAECLTLQLKSRQAERDVDAVEQACIAAALRICAQHGAVDLLARRDAKRLAQLTGDGEDAVRAAMQLIGRLDPKPGRQFADVERNTVVPDVIVSSVGSGAAQRFRVQLNPDVMPKLRVHDIYANALRGGKGGENHQALAQRLQEARWFIKNIQQRFDTILRVSTAIVERQRNFFIHGELAMRPMVQRELADELGVHESTISRVTTAKYMATPRGTFELKYFFGSALGTEAGGNASSTAVRALIKQFIAAEDTAKPLSDNQIADMLKEQGIDCARRTVAKYREGLRIPIASLRKATAGAA
ncbi:RNA polymerase factor sigma-54 [Ottowia beijingensis]|uniref:RNA polymerase sigma-54 factor n=1 Tax=Ottowia beijingensis TaxID=1207057 RepID=A0A853IXM6_9BURK|nr:RNA polymerase factor sigma-54 [Ottowia beijingensis]NZA01748.1 RNA polymerase factor sigma-54 [Ottowia beijingensis]